MNDMDRQTPRFFESDGGFRFLNRLIRYRQVGLMIFSCVLGSWLTWHFWSSERAMAAVFKIVGIFLNFPLLIFLYRGYQVLLSPLAKSYADLPLPSALESAPDVSEP
jgi:hypothetical protein